MGKKKVEKKKVFRKDDLGFECTVLVNAKNMKITIDEDKRGGVFIVMAQRSCCRGVA